MDTYAYYEDTLRISCCHYYATPLLRQPVDGHTPYAICHYVIAIDIIADERIDIDALIRRVTCYAWSPPCHTLRH